MIMRRPGNHIFHSCAAQSNDIASESDRGEPSVSEKTFEIVAASHQA